jgi:hypothetical protein
LGDDARGLKPSGRRVSARVGNVWNNDPSLIEPIETVG